jgi:hypothetical protein
VLHNTLWADPSLSASIVSGLADYGAGSGGWAEAFYLRNNIIHTTRYGAAVAVANMWDEDYNHFSTTDRARGLQFVGTNYTTNVSAYRTASKQGAHTNVSSDFITAPLVSNALAGDLALPMGSPLIDAGVVVPNISDRAGVDYTGAAPDLGATEY